MGNSDVTYSIDGTALDELGIWVAESNGIICKPALKDPVSADLPWRHGTMYDLGTVYFKEQTITLKCFMECKSYDDYINKIQQLKDLLDRKSTHTLLVAAGTNSLSYQVISKSSIPVDKDWHPGAFVADLTLSLLEPEPANRRVTGEPANRRVTGKGSTTSKLGSNDVKYSIDGYYLDGFDIYVSGSDGITDKPEIKDLTGYDWGGYDGTQYHTGDLRYKERTISLQCFMECNGYDDFISKAMVFLTLLSKAGTHRLMIEAGSAKPLVYEVFCKDAIDLSKAWNPGKFVATFTIKLIEPEPVKMVLKGEGNVSISVNSTDSVNIYWGNTYHYYDFGGGGKDVSLATYTKGYIIITGDIARAAIHFSGATLIWNKLL